MKIHIIVNPKAKSQLLEWVENERDKLSSSVQALTFMDNIKRISEIMKDVQEDFVLEKNRPYSVVIVDNNVFLLEMPHNPYEIFEYAAHNPGKLSNKTMRIICPLLKVLITQMFERVEEQYQRGNHA